MSSSCRGKLPSWLAFNSRSVAVVLSPIGRVRLYPKASQLSRGSVDSGRHSFLPIDLRNSPREDLILVHLALVHILIDHHTYHFTFAESFGVPESFRKFYWTFPLMFNLFVYRKILLFHFSPSRKISQNFSHLAIQLLLALWELNLRSVAQEWLSIYDSASREDKRKKWSHANRILRFIIIERARLCYSGAPLLSRLQRVRISLRRVRARRNCKESRWRY